MAIAGYKTGLSEIDGNLEKTMGPGDLETGTGECELSGKTAN